MIEEYEHFFHPRQGFETPAPCCRSNEIVQKRKESIVTCFEITLGLTNSTADEELFAAWNPHLREDFMTHFANVAEEFKNFALFQRFVLFCGLYYKSPYYRNLRCCLVVS